MLRTAALVVLLAWIDSSAHACDAHVVRLDPAARKAQAELIDAYELASNASPRKDLLERGQQAWDEYRQATCEVMSDRGGEPGLEPLAQCLAFMARERTRELLLLSY